MVGCGVYAGERAIPNHSRMALAVSKASKTPCETSSPQDALVPHLETVQREARRSYEEIVRKVAERSPYVLC